MKNKVLKWAIVGCGVIGEHHARAVSEVEGCECVACVDVNSEASRALAERYNLQGYFTDLGLMLDKMKPDVISVCTPSGRHEEVCVQAAKAGCHLLVEKPIEISLPAADRIIKTCRQYKVKIGVVFQRRMALIPKQVKRAIDDNMLGDLIIGDMQVKYYRPQSYYQSAGWRGTWEIDGGGALMNQGIHSVDLLQWLMGPVKSITAYTGVLAHQCEVEDTVVAIVKFVNGALGVLEATTACYPAYGHRIEIHGKKGSIMLQGDMRAGDQIIHAGFTDQAISFDAAGYNAQKPDPADGFPGGHILHVEDMIKAIRNDQDPVVTGEEARKSLQIVLAIYESARSGREVSLV